MKKQVLAALIASLVCFGLFTTFVSVSFSAEQTIQAEPRNGNWPWSGRSSLQAEPRNGNWPWSGRTASGARV